MSEIATDAVLEGGGGAADFRTSGGGRGKAVSRPGYVAFTASAQRSDQSTRHGDMQ